MAAPGETYTSLPDTVPTVLETTEVTRRGLLQWALGAAAAVVVGSELAGCTSSASAPETPPTPLASGTELSTTGPKSPEQSAAEAFLKQTGESLLALGEKSHGGMRYRSRIQKGYYADRDEGGASVGMGYMALIDLYPKDPRWLDGATQVGNWLTAVSKTDGKGGRFWPDYADDDGDSGSYYTSFDDGAIGIGDFFWRLGEKTNDPRHLATAKEAVEWTFSQAENTGSDASPQYRWKWDAGDDNSSPRYMGLGEGLEGIIHALATFYVRTKDSDPAFAAKCRHYVDGALRELATVRTGLGNNDGDSQAVPEQGRGQDGNTEENSGYLSGAAGAAFMFTYLGLKAVLGNADYEQQAAQLFSWLDAGSDKDVTYSADGPRATSVGSGKAAWRLALDPQGGNNNRLATGMEEGAAGIGWAHLQAWLATKQDKYLSEAKGAGNWLLAVALNDGRGGLSWREDMHPNSRVVHPNLNNGTAGIGMFLYDLYEATKDPRYLAAAQGARTSLVNTALHVGGKIGWRDHDSDAGYFEYDPSWHWGNAGIIAFLTRMLGGALDIPDEQSSVTSAI